MSEVSEAYRPLFERAMADKGVFLNDHLEKVIDIAEEVSLARDVRIMYRLTEQMRTFSADSPEDIEQIIRESGLGDPSALEANANVVPLHQGQSGPHDDEPLVQAVTALREGAEAINKAAHRLAQLLPS